MHPLHLPSEIETVQTQAIVDDFQTQISELQAQIRQLDTVRAQDDALQKKTMRRQLAGMKGSKQRMRELALLEKFARAKKPYLAEKKNLEVAISALVKRMSVHQAFIAPIRYASLLA